MVKALHAAGIEVILDVVYNHTAEGNHLGPTLSMKGIDNQAYYRVVEDDPRYYMDYTGTGNSLNVRHPHSLQLIMDSLRYWVTEMHVDGFRFDLASTLAREFYDVDRLATFFELVQQDPVVSQVKLIAEPWDIGPGGYQVGGFPPQWSEWNGDYRDTVRDFWRGEPSLGEFASRVAGSSDLYEHSGRRPFASINFVTAHDGFTLRDLVSYNEKHNDANGEGNNDGESHNRSWNHGVEGPTDDPEILAARSREQRNFLATLLLSQGVPMILHGDELGRTQHGNNNTYAQDSELSWVHWDDVDRPLLEFTAAVVQLRQSHPTFRRKRFFTGSTVRTGPTGQERLNDIVWLHPDGHPMEDDALGGRRPGDRHVPQRRRHRRQGGPRRDHPRRPLPALLQRRRPGRPHPAAGGVRRGLGRRRSTPAGPPTPPPPASRAAPSTWSTAACSSSRSTPRPRPSPTTRSRRRSRPSSTAGTRTDVTRSPRQHLPLQITAVVRPVRGGAAAAVPARPRRRLGLPLADPGGRAGLGRTATTSSRTTGSTRPAAAPRGWPRCPPRRGGSAWACSSTSCPTTSGWPRRRPTPGGRTCSQHGRESAYAGLLRRRLDGRRRLDPDRSGPQLPPVLHHRHPGRRSGSRTARSSTPPTSRSGAGSTRGWSTACGSTTRTACATRAATSTTWPTLTGGAYVLVEKILEPGEELADLVGDGRHHRATTPSAWSTGC